MCHNCFYATQQSYIYCILEPLFILKRMHILEHLRLFWESRICFKFPFPPYLFSPVLTFRRLSVIIRIVFPVAFAVISSVFLISYFYKVIYVSIKITHSWIYFVSLCSTSCYPADRLRVPMGTNCICRSTQPQTTGQGVQVASTQARAPTRSGQRALQEGGGGGS